MCISDCHLIWLKLISVKCINIQALYMITLRMRFEFSSEFLIKLMWDKVMNRTDNIEYNYLEFHSIASWAGTILLTDILIFEISDVFTEVEERLGSIFNHLGVFLFFPKRGYAVSWSLCFRNGFGSFGLEELVFAENGLLGSEWGGFRVGEGLEAVFSGDGGKERHGSWQFQLWQII